MYKQSRTILDFHSLSGSKAFGREVTHRLIWTVTTDRLTKKKGSLITLTWKESLESTPCNKLYINCTLIPAPLFV